jgi:hypothetical protein
MRESVCKRERERESERESLGGWAPFGGEALWWLAS